MKAYEGVFIFPPDSAPDARKTQLKNLDDLFSKFQAEIVQKTEWGKKPLGYLIRKHSEGHFMVIDYKMDTSKTEEFRKALELLEDVIKYMITIKNVESEKVAAAKAAKPAVTPSSHSASAAHA